MSKGEAPMGRPIQKKWFGEASNVGSEIIVNGAMFSDGTTATNAYIIKQTGSAAYIVQDAAMTHAPEILFMVNAASTTALLPGQCFINATPFGGTALPCYKINQFRVDIFDVANTVPREVGAPVPDHATSYSWSTIPATKAGQADLITESAGTGIVDVVTVGTAGTGYFLAPSVSFPTTGGASGATATATISAAGAVTGITVTSGGSGYTAGAATVSPPPASVTATATATQTGGAITAITLVGGGGFYTTAPAVTIAGAGTGATATATIAAGKVTGFNITAPGTGYVTPTVTIAAPPAATAATATFTVKSTP
jgi:hypothetical protein